jgi:uncharacterized protein YkwD
MTSLLAAIAIYSTTTLFQATNQARIEHHLPPLVWSNKLYDAAGNSADDLARSRSFTHQGAWDYLRQTGYRWQWAGQNLARGFSTPSETVQAWMNSPTHRSNILYADFRDTGIALETSVDGKVYVVQYFATPFPSTNNPD